MRGTRSNKHAPAEKAAHTLVRCGETVDISCVYELHQELSKALSKSLPVTMDVSRVERVDTAALQLFVAFCRQAGSRQLPVRWNNPSEALCHAARLSGLSQILNLGN
jgi:anti-anti-sigma factor